MIDADRRRDLQRAQARVRELLAPDREARKIQSAQRKAKAKARAREHGAKIDQDRIKPKGGRERDQGYISWVHDSGLACIACLIEGRPHTRGEPNPIEFAHQRIKGWKKGVRGDDAEACPLCRWHHQLAPNACDKGQRQFWTRLGVDAAELCAGLHAAYRGGRSGQTVISDAARAAATSQVQPHDQ